MPSRMASSRVPVSRVLRFISIPEQLQDHLEPAGDDYEFAVASPWPNSANHNISCFLSFVLVLQSSQLNKVRDDSATDEAPAGT